MTLVLKKLCKSDRSSIVYHQVTTSTIGTGKMGTNSICDMCSRIYSNIPVRFTMVSLIILATAIDYITRVNINIAIVTMVSSNSSHSPIQRSTCPARDTSSLKSVGPVDSSTDYQGVSETSSQQFDWSPTVQGIILGSFWYSYILMQVPSGRMAEEFGGKSIVAISLIGSALINFITPLVAPSVTLLVMSRMALGFIQGGIFPSCYAIIGRWLPLSERSLGFAFMEIGATIGSVIATTSSGYLSEHGPAGGWPSVFYVSGITSLFAFILWYLYSSSDPLDHPNITDAELKYIQANDVASTTTDDQSKTYYNSEHNLTNTVIPAVTFASPPPPPPHASSSSSSSFDASPPLPPPPPSLSSSSVPSTDQAPVTSCSSSTFSTYDCTLHLTSRSDVKSLIINDYEKSPFHSHCSQATSNGLINSSTSIAFTSSSSNSLSYRPNVPWRLIITSQAVISILISKFSLSFSYFTLLSKLPSYLHDVLHIPPTQNGLLNASLYMTTCISLLASSHVSERMINERILTRTACRKVFLATASLGTALCFSLIPWAACDTNLVMILLLCGNFFLGLNAGGDVPVAGEITLNFPATIYAMGNMFGCSTGFIAPYVIGVILESDDTRQVNLIHLWSKVYYLAAGIALIGALIFVIFGSANRQPWDFLPEDTHHLSDYFYENTFSTSGQLAGVPTATCSPSWCNSRPESTIHHQRERKRIQ